MNTMERLIRKIRELEDRIQRLETREGAPTQVAPLASVNTPNFEHSVEKETEIKNPGVA